MCCSMNVELDLDVRLGNIPVIFAVSPQGTEGVVLRDVVVEKASHINRRVVYENRK